MRGTIFDGKTLSACVAVGIFFLFKFGQLVLTLYHCLFLVSPFSRLEKVCGGNILEEQHLGLLIKELSTIRSKKVAATFFFHQHVIAILQIRRPSKAKKGETVLWYDIIDSLPQTAFLQRIHDNSNTNGSTTVNSVDTQNNMNGQPRDLLGNASDWMNRINHQWDDLMDETRVIRDALVSEISTGSNSGGTRDTSNKQRRTNLPRNNTGSTRRCNIAYSSGRQQEMLNRPDAVRIRCYDTVSLKLALQWYACSVFTNENANYIDTYQWDEKLTDFDPRVFQAFLWTEA